MFFTAYSEWFVRSHDFLTSPQVYTWGCNDEGALGRPTEDGEEYTPELVKMLEGVVIVQISAGDCHTVFLTNMGLVYCCGIFRVRTVQYRLLRII